MVCLPISSVSCTSGDKMSPGVGQSMLRTSCKLTLSAMRFKFATKSRSADLSFAFHQALTTLSGLAAIEDVDNLKVSTSAWSWLFFLAAFLKVSSCDVQNCGSNHILVIRFDFFVRFTGDGQHGHFQGVNLGGGDLVSDCSVAQA